MLAVAEDQLIVTVAVLQPWALVESVAVEQVDLALLLR
jgi:hypothetical protein